MEFTTGVQGRTPALMALLTAGLLVAAVGCGTKSADQSAADKPAATESQPASSAASAGGAKKAAAAPAARKDDTPGVRTDHVRLTDAGCVEFEPHWAIITIGKSLTWHSDLKTPVTIHVSPGAFDKSEFIVRPGGSISSGPARATGIFTIGSQPNACQGPPLGVRGSGPGLTVEAAGH